MDSLAQMTCGQSGLAWLMILVCGLLMLIVLIQRGRGGGLSGAFGGGGGGGGAFGAKTGDVFTWITVIVAGIFLLLTVVSNFVFDKSLIAAQPESQVSSTSETEDSGEKGEETPVGGTIPVPAGEVPTGGATGADAAAKDSDTNGNAPKAGDTPVKSGGNGSASKTEGNGAAQAKPPEGDAVNPEADKPDSEGNAKP